MSQFCDVVVLLSSLLLLAYFATQAFTYREK